MSDYPEHDRMAAVQEQTQAIGEFLGWLTNQGIQLMVWREDLTDLRLTDPKCREAERGSPAPCAPQRPDGGGSYTPDGTVWWRQHCQHWTVSDDGECCRCGRGHFYEVTGIKSFVHDSRSVEQLLADWAGIDLDKIEAEKRQILAAIDGANGG